MAERRSGLGPQGLAALRRASATQHQIDELHRAPVIGRRSTAPANPAATDTEEASDRELPTSWRPIESSRISEAAYNPKTHTLFVRFVKPLPEGTPWIYEDVPPNVWRNFLRSSSKGKFVNRVLNGFDYHRGDF